MKTHLANLYKYKDLFFELIKKDIKIKYKNSILGVLWSILNPLLMMVVLTIVFMEIFKNNIPNFPVYVLIGRILYQFFSESTNFALDSVYANGQLLRKIYVPKYYFPISRVCSSFVTTLLAFIPLIFMMIYSGIQFQWINLLFIIPLLYLLLIAIGIGLILAAINVFFRDIKHFYSIMLLVVMYMTPIFYPDTIIPEKYMSIIMLNPLYPIVQMFRDVVMYGQFFEPLHHNLALSYAIIYPIIGIVVFYKLQDRFIHHL